MNKGENAYQKVCIQYFTTPCGQLILASTGDELCLCDWYGMPCAVRNKHKIGRELNAIFSIESSPVINQTMKQLDEYFAGIRKQFSIPIHPIGTDFQIRVWRALLNIPYGDTRSYSEIAKIIGNERSVRAVAQAIGANGISIIIPCHRVIGSILSFSVFFGGFDKKEFLLKHETHFSFG